MASNNQSIVSDHHEKATQARHLTGVYFPFSAIKKLRGTADIDVWEARVKPAETDPGYKTWDRLFRRVKLWLHLCLDDDVIRWLLVSPLPQLYADDFYSAVLQVVKPPNYWQVTKAFLKAMHMKSYGYASVERYVEDFKVTVRVANLHHQSIISPTAAANFLIHGIKDDLIYWTRSNKRDLLSRNADMTWQDYLQLCDHAVYQMME
ncbi:hypothetical protein ASPZODRAFT_143771 [Penicilliopsis zonata CBS 506.65]|uniref:Retrotransposon gag domain-containing protein n=1 Tax=Penicilliopsis zonata CBS 506.65 TaxID=1073090 RepID=A0A1L9SFL1_9EURO|nr:hypothetical protein ASPZODRAFT_143771 [Penicilliopsis zonata CBS 506.65]OJJ45903.1 hypothetical protein ASPZODRAFT_143771 [Penicilliopsis zonata CBS 506.65]